jgi:hypothetical protein
VIAIASLLAVVTLSVLVTRVATVVLVATGISSQEARFQARSALTGTGFTTREAEAVVTHPLRRRVVMTLMLVGNAGLVAAASSLIIGFRGGSTGAQLWRVLELLAGLMLLVAVSRSRRVDRWLTGTISTLINRHTTLPRRDLGGLLQLSGDYSVKELAVTEDDWLAGRPLGELGLRDEGIVVLGLTRKDGQYLGAPTGTTEVRDGDVLVVYGRSESLEDVDRRPPGVIGDRRHRLAVMQQADHELDQQRRDRPAPADGAPPPGAPGDIPRAQHH